MDRRFQITLTGTMPLLMHADNIDGADLVEAWKAVKANKDGSKAGDDRGPAWKWQTYIYADDKHLAIPTANIMTCIRQAASQITMKGQKTYKSLSQSAIMFDTEYAAMTVAGKPVPLAALSAMRDEPFASQAAKVQLLGFKLDVRRATVMKAKHVRVRPRFEAWAVTGAFAVNAGSDLLSDDVLREMFDLAGQRVGLGDWRPGCPTPGPFGKFTAKLKAI